MNGNSEPKLIFPGLAGFYASVSDLWYPMIRVAIGLFTRFFAAALAIELLIAMFAAHWVKGFSVGAGGYEYVLFLGIVMFAIALRGGGPYSVDRLIGREL